jgi:hypothetical protein
MEVERPRDRCEAVIGREAAPKDSFSVGLKRVSAEDVARGETIAGNKDGVGWEVGRGWTRQRRVARCALGVGAGGRIVRRKRICAERGFSCAMRWGARAKNRQRRSRWRSIPHAPPQRTKARPPGTPACRTVRLCVEDGAPGPRAQDDGKKGQGPVWSLAPFAADSGAGGGLVGWGYWPESWVLNHCCMRSARSRMWSGSTKPWPSLG